MKFNLYKKLEIDPFLESRFILTSLFVLFADYLFIGEPAEIKPTLFFRRYITAAGGNTDLMLDVRIRLFMKWN